MAYQLESHRTNIVCIDCPCSGSSHLMVSIRNLWLKNVYSKACTCQDVDPHEAIEMELDEEEDAAVYEHLYDDKPFLLTKMVNGPSYRRWKLPLPVCFGHRMRISCLAECQVWELSLPLIIRCSLSIMSTRHMLLLHMEISPLPSNQAMPVRSYHLWHACLMRVTLFVLLSSHQPMVVHIT